MSRALRILIVTVAVAYAILIFPYARALWWLHAYASAPARTVLPVAGVAPDDLQPSFGAPRSHGPHEGIDILAPAGTDVLAAADGVIIGNRSTPIGGNVLWIMGSGRRLYYYAHLRERAPGMRLGRLVHAGEVVGFVGNTGNAVRTPSHLHFAIYLVTSDFYPLRYGPMDPFPLLRSGSDRAQLGPRG